MKMPLEVPEGIGPQIKNLIAAINDVLGPWVQPDTEEPQVPVTQEQDLEKTIRELADSGYKFLSDTCDWEYDFDVEPDDEGKILVTPLIWTYCDFEGYIYLKKEPHFGYERWELPKFEKPAEYFPTFKEYQVRQAKTWEKEFEEEGKLHKYITDRELEEIR
jgi:hypothetical protein